MTDPEPDAPPDDRTGGDDLDAGLAQLKDLLAAEGVAGDEGWSPEKALEEAAAPEAEAPEEAATAKAAPAAEPTRRRRRTARRDDRSRRADDEQAFRDLGSQLAAEALDIKLDDEGMTATVGRIGPETTRDEILSALRRHKVSAGIDEQAIAAALRRAAGGPQYEVVVARGRPPVVHRPPTLRQHLPAELHTQNPLPLDALRQALTGPSLEVVQSWRGAAHVVSTGAVLVDIAPAEYQPGEDLFGAPVEPTFEALPELPHGEHTQLAQDGRAVVAGLYGYAGVLDGEPAVVAPVWTAPDAMEAHFVCIQPQGMPAPSAEELTAILQACWVEHGVLAEALAAVRQRLEGGSPVPRTVAIARGTPPRPGKDGSIQYRVPLAQLPRWNDLQVLAKAADRDGLETAIEALRGSGRHLAPVHAGQLLATLVPAESGVVGRDIHGEEIDAEDGKDCELSAGANVDLDGDRLRATAALFGRVAVHGAEQLTVVPPLWLAADRMQVCYLNLDAGGEPCAPTAQELAQVVDGDRRLDGLDLSRWDDLRARLESGALRDVVLPLADGEPPKPGVDARFDWAVAVGGRAGRILADGSIDLRDRRVITVVRSGDLLGRLQPAREGAPGRNALGADIAPPPVSELEIATDSRIEGRPEDDGGADGIVAYYAIAEGGVTVAEETRRQRGRVKQRLHLSLFAVSEIDGDVDYATGHLDFSGDIIIKGSVRPLFEVRATGSVTIGGNVEPGAVVRAGGDIAVGGGVIGARTRLDAGGSVLAKFVQEASVSAGGSVEVGAYVFDASVRAGGKLVVAGKGDGKGRALVGGLAWAAQGIETPSLGSPSNPRIRLVAGVDPGAMAVAEGVRAKARICQARQAEALARLGVRQIDARVLRHRAESAPPERRQAVLDGLKEVVELGLLGRELDRRLQEIAESQRELARHATVVVSGPIFAGPELRLGESVLQLGADASQLRYRLAADDDGQLSIAAEPL